MKKIIAFCMFLTLPFFSYGQLEKFDLSTYKLPDILTRKLDFNGNFGGHTSTLFQSESSVNSSGNWSNSLDNSFQGSGSLSFYQFKNSPNYQGSLNIISSAYLGHNKYDHVNREIREDSTASLNLRINSLNRWYLRKQWFAELDIQTRPSYIRNNEYRAIENANSVNLLIGYGRIEPVADARLAVYILQDLKSSSRLIREPNSQEIIEIASKISELKNKRFFDHRLRRIYELKSIDSLLTNLGLVEQNDIVYYTHVTDNWGYSAGPQRWAGKRFSGGINSYSNAGKTAFEPMGFNTIINFFYNDLVIAPVAKFEWHKPLNLYWQRIIEFSTSYAFTSLKTAFSSTPPGDHLIDNDWINRFSLTYKYYPNSRTSISLNPSLYLTKEESLDVGQSLFSDQFSVSPRLRLFMDYYFSPQLRIEANYYFLYGYTRDQNSYTTGLPGAINNSHRFNQSFSATLLYSIF